MTRKFLNLVIATLVTTPAIIVAPPLLAQQSAPTAPNSHNSSSAEAMQRYDQAKAALDQNDFATAAPLLGPLCDDGHRQSCYIAGALAAEGLGVEQNRITAISFYGKACDRGHGQSCTDIGVIYSGHAKKHETDPPRNWETSASYFQKGCDAGDGRGCAHLADRYEIGLGVEKNLDTALQLYRKAAGLEIEQWVRTSVEGRIKALTGEQKSSE